MESNSGSAGTVYLESISRTGNQLNISCKYGEGDGLRFSTTYWYEFPLDELDKVYGQHFMENVYFHCAMFEINKLCSLNPAEIDLGKWSGFLVDALEDVWRKVTVQTFGQWRYENGLPQWNGPSFRTKPDTLPSSAKKGKVAEIITQPNSPKYLCFCGGGKDSLVALKLMESIQEPHASFAYSHSVYGQARPQHQLIDRLLDECSMERRNRMWMFDDFLDSPLMELMPPSGVKTMADCEIPSATFAAIPIALKYGYTHFCLGNERSANVGNLTWNATGEEINHQWSKSIEAQLLIGSYLKSELVSNLTYFSILMPIHDSLILQLLAQQPKQAICSTHSCNVRKPWCCRCAKCCYVWLWYTAYLSEGTVRATFGDGNLFDAEENLVFFQQLLGLADHTPFECIGQVEEVCLAFELCRRKGIRGKAMEVYETKVWKTFDAKKAVKKFFHVYSEDAHFPAPLSDQLLSHLNKVATAAQKKLLHELHE
eukprot:m.154356 g.154356  ORF g.154356 m.154356 type:complete len:484 (+) comp38636_c0_seq1:110-1561(+)